MFKAMHCLLILAVLLNTAQAGLLQENQRTDNQKDFRNPDTADINAGDACPLVPGQWSYHYWDESANQITPLLRGDPENQRFAGKWVIDNRKPENTWWLGSHGQISSDNRALMLVYSVDQNEAGNARLHGALDITDYKQCRLRIYQSSENDLYQINPKNLKLLFDSDQTQRTSIWKTIQVTPGNDICFVFQGGPHWWITRKLTAQIKQSPATK